jgi:hypothetical protein
MSVLANQPDPVLGGSTQIEAATKLATPASMAANVAA